MSELSITAGSMFADEDGNGLSQQNEIIIIAVSTVVGAFAFGTILGFFFCFLRKRRREGGTRASGSETRLVRGGGFEIIEAPQQGFSHWNGRRVESYTPFIPSSEPPLNRHFDPATRSGGSSNGMSPVSPVYHNPSIANPFIPQPPSARKPVGSAPSRNRHTYAAGLEALAGHAAARHQERAPRAVSSYQEHNHGFERQPPTVYDTEPEQIPESQHGEFRRRGHAEQMIQQTSHSEQIPQEPQYPTAAFGLAGFVGSSREKQRHGALEPGYLPIEVSIPGHRLYASHENIKNNYHQQFDDVTVEPYPVSRFSDSVVDSDSGFSPLSDAPKQPFPPKGSVSERRLTNDAPLLAHPTDPQNITRRALLEGTSTNNSAVRIPRIPEKVARAYIPQSPPTSPKSPVAGQGRLSFSRPRPKPESITSSSSSIHNRGRSSGESGRYGPLDKEIEPPPPIPWSATPRGSSESMRSVGTDGKPRRLRLGDFVRDEEKYGYGVGQAL